MQIRRILLVLFGVWIAAGMAGARAEDIVLSGAGATFPQPLYEKWVQVYNAASPHRISYLGVGSGKGIRQLLDRQVDFGGTDVRLSKEERNQAPAAILHVPTCIGAVAIVYNLPVLCEVKLSPEQLVDIFLGRTRQWKDVPVAPKGGGSLPGSLNITLIHRSDGSGTNFILTDYLSRISGRWKDSVGRGKRVRWPVGIGVETNSGVAETVRRIPGSIGYVELTYAKRNDLAAASIQNASGRFVHPTLDSLKKAAETETPENQGWLIANTGVPGGYPISAFTWLILYEEQDYHGRSFARAKALTRFLWWALHQGQAYCEPLNYAPLPEPAAERAEQILRSIRFGGIPILESESD
jgi:phosphate transport system substrate-binding protein